MKTITIRGILYNSNSMELTRGDIQITVKWIVAISDTVITFVNGDYAKCDVNLKEIKTLINV